MNLIHLERWFPDALLFSLILNAIVFRYADLVSEEFVTVTPAFGVDSTFLGVLMSTEMERIQFS